MTSVAEKSSRRSRRSTPYALLHLDEEYRMLCWGMQRVLRLARDYPCLGQYPALDVEQSSLLATFAARLERVSVQLCQVLTPAIAARVEQERLAFDDDSARYDKQRKKGCTHATPQ